MDDVRTDVLAAVAELVPVRAGFVRVGVDGVDGSGKTTFADSLAEVLRARGRNVVRILEDDFLNPRAVRHRRGRDSPEGFLADSYDLERLRADVLDPFAPDGSGRYRERSLDLAADAPLDPPWNDARPGSVLVLDGMFLHRDELIGVWDVSVLLDVPFAETCRRMSLRDGSHPDPEHPSMRRYVEGQRLYLGRCTPLERATVVVDNSEFDEPRIVRQPTR
jgi:uridine kinase